MSNYGLLVTTLSFFSKASLSAKAFLSYYLSRSKKLISVITFLEPYQSLFYPKRIQTPSKTMRTASGGFANPLISVISALLSFFKA